MSITYYYKDIPLQKLVDTLEALQKHPILYCEMENAGIPNTKEYLLVWLDTDPNLTGARDGGYFGVPISVEDSVIAIDKGCSPYWNGQGFLSGYLKAVGIDRAWTD